MPHERLAGPKCDLRSYTVQDGRKPYTTWLTQRLHDGVVEAAAIIGRAQDVHGEGVRVEVLQSQRDGGLRRRGVRAEQRKVLTHPACLLYTSPSPRD